MKVRIKTEDKFELDAVFSKRDTKKGIVFAHGLTVDKDDEGILVRADKRLSELGFSTLRFDFRAHGKSQGNTITDLTISGELRDLEAVFDYMHREGIEKIGLVGASFGGGTCALFASKYPEKVQALFLANPVLDFEKCFLKPTTPWAKKHFRDAFKRIDRKGFIEVGSRKFKVGRQLFEEMNRYFPYKELDKYKKPIFVVHGDKDSKVSYQDTVDCFNKLSSTNKKLETIKGSEHGFHEEPYETMVVEMIVEFFRKEIK